MSKKEIAVQEDKALDIVNREGLLDWLETFGVGANLNDKEKIQFCKTAEAFNLNPLKRGIHCIAYTSKGKRTLSLVTGYEVYIRRAERSGMLNGWSITHAGSTKTPEDPLRAVFTIHRKDWDHPLTHEVYLFEYMKDNAFWNGKPLTMIKKTCIAQAFRLAFPEEVGGMPYTSDEMSEEMELAGETDTTEPAEKTFEEMAKEESGDGPESFEDEIPWEKEETKIVGLSAEKRSDMIQVIEQLTEYVVNNKQWLPTYADLIEYVDKLEITAEQEWKKTGQDPIKFIDVGFKAIVKAVEENKAADAKEKQPELSGEKKYKEEDLEIF